MAANKFIEIDDKLPSIGWFLALSKPNWLNGQSSASSHFQQKRRRPASSYHPKNRTNKKERRCNSAKANFASHQDIDYRNIDYSREDVRPPLSNAQLILEALKYLPNNEGTLNEIFALLIEKFAYFRMREENESWKNSLRHVLSQNNGLFKKLPTRKGRRGTIWTVVNEHSEQNEAKIAKKSHENMASVEIPNEDHNYVCAKSQSIDKESETRVQLLMESSEAYADSNQSFINFENTNKIWPELTDSDDFSIFPDFDLMESNFLPTDWDDELFFSVENLN